VRRLTPAFWSAALLVWSCATGVPLAHAASPHAAPGARATADVIPAPAQVIPGRGAFLVTERTVVWLPRDPGASESARYFVDLLRRAHRGWLTAIVGSPGRTAGPVIVFNLERAPPGANPESYEINVTPRRVVVSAGDRRGLLYGAVTLWQLCTAGMGAPATGAQSARRITLPALRIVDMPRFRWRGLMLDSARHFQSPEFVMRYIDWMALHKLNVLGWHLTDDQAWRLEVRKFPRLTSVGAWRVEAGRASARDLDPATGRPRLYGGYYTQDQVRRIVGFAASRNVTIVPEIEMPGHATAAIVAYPQLGVTGDPAQSVPADWGIFPNLFNVEESTFAFLEDVLAEVMELFPGQYIHVGGDEAVKDQWKASARVQERMRELGVASEEALQGYFTHRMGEYLRAHGRRLVGWDEILEGGVPADAAVMSWRGVQGAITAAAAGHDAVLSPDPTLYLDSRQGRSPSEPPGRGTVETLADVYHFDPLPGPLAADQAHVLGLQANLWTEHVRTEERAAYMTWPRAAAVAEIGWSPPARLDWTDFLARLPAEFRRLTLLGVHYSDDVFAPPHTAGPHDRHMSQDLKTCTDKLVLSLEDDAPIEGARAVFLIDIMNPCWIFPAAELAPASRLTVAVGQVPFNFQIGKDIEAIKLNPPRTAAGELEVRLDSCDGDPVAVLPLAPAADNDSVTELPPVAVPGARGRHDLCFRFTQRTLDPMWAIDWVQLLP
jgi:hexosaminidase